MPNLTQYFFFLPNPKIAFDDSDYYGFSFIELFTLKLYPWRVCLYMILILSLPKTFDVLLLFWGDQWRLIYFKKKRKNVQRLFSVINNNNKALLPASFFEVEVVSMDTRNNLATKKSMKRRKKSFCNNPLLTNGHFFRCGF